VCVCVVSVTVMLKYMACKDVVNVFSVADKHYM